MPGPRLTLDERITIEALWKNGHTETEIAATINRHKSTINRELARNNSARHGPKHGDLAPHRSRRNTPAGGSNYRWGYQADWAQRQARNRAGRPKLCKLARPGTTLYAPAHRATQVPTRITAVADGQLWQIVRSKLATRWSPMQISQWLATNVADHPELQVSHETIYQALYLQTRGNLRQDLTRQVALRSGRTRRTRRPEAAGALRSTRLWTKDFNISTRPPDVEDRAIPGNWEGDLVIGAGGRSAIITLVERSTRYVMLGHLPTDRTSASVVDVLVALARKLPTHLMRSITWDCGSEMAQHAQFSIATDCRVFFADPHSPWQRGSNENTNGLLRQYYPKGETDFSTLTQADLDITAHELNGRPRQTLGWKNPRQCLVEALVATTP